MLPAFVDFYFLPVRCYFFAPELSAGFVPAAGFLFPFAIISTSTYL